MNPYQLKILRLLQLSNLKFPRLSQAEVWQEVVPVIASWTQKRIIANHLSKDSQQLFQDCYLSAPDIFDPAEFLGDELPNFESLLSNYFNQWVRECYPSYK